MEKKKKKTFLCCFILKAQEGERTLGDRNEPGQNEMDRPAPVGGCFRKDNGDCIRRPFASGTGNIAFPAEKNNMRKDPPRRWNWQPVWQSCCSL